MKGTRGTVVINKYTLIKKVVEKSLYNKFQLLVAKVCKLTLLENYTYVIRLDYKGTLRLKPKDIIVNDKGVTLVVIQELNRMAMVQTLGKHNYVPFCKGKFFLLDKTKN